MKTYPVIGVETLREEDVERVARAYAEESMRRDYPFYNHETQKRLAHEMAEGRARISAFTAGYRAAIAAMPPCPITGEDVQRAIEAERDACTAIVAEWMKPSVARLRAGELSAQEVRCLKSVLGNIVQHIQERAGGTTEDQMRAALEAGR